MKQNEEEMSDQIAVMNRVSRDLALITKVEEAKEYRDRAAALSAYARAAGKSLESVNEIQEIKLRMERKAGELLDLEIPQGGDRKSRGRDVTLSLSDVGISRHQSARWRRIAAIPEPIFEAFLVGTKESGEEITQAAALNLYRETAKAQKRKDIEDMEVTKPTDGCGTIILGRMEEELPKLDEGSIDLIVTDPPYGLGETAEIRFKQREDMSAPAGGWDEANVIALYDVWLPLLKRVLKPAGSLYMFFDCWYISFVREKLIQHGFTPKNAMVWFKTNPPPSVRQRNFISCCEHLYFATAGDGYTFNWQGHNQMFESLKHPICGGSERLDHPCQKPVALLKRFIEVSSNPGDVVLDAFAGVGSTGAAARELGRKYIMVEENEFYYKQACSRLS